MINLNDKVVTSCNLQSHVDLLKQRDEMVEAITELAEYAAAEIGLQVPDCVAGPIAKARAAIAKAKEQA